MNQFRRVKYFPTVFFFQNLTNEYIVVNKFVAVDFCIYLLVNGGARGVMVIIVRNGHGDTSSISGTD